MVQHPGRHAQQTSAAHPSGNQAAAGRRRPRPHLPPRVLRPGARHRAPLDRHPRGGARQVQVLPFHAAGARLRPRRGPGHPRPHLLQERVDQPLRLAQDQLRPAPVLLRQAGGHDQRHHRDRCRTVGCRPLVCRQDLRARLRRLPGEDHHAAEALPFEHHAHLRRRCHRFSLYVHPCW